MRLSDAEWKVMNALWACEPATARAVLESLEDSDWAYTTVKTMLARLVEKGILTEEKSGNKSVYASCMSRQVARRSAVRSLLDKAFDGTFGSLLHHLVDDERLSAKEKSALRKALATRKRSSS